MYLRRRTQYFFHDRSLCSFYLPLKAGIIGSGNIGTDLFRNHFNTNIWILALEKKLETLKNANVVITDCRFENEYNFLKNITYSEVKFFYIERCEPPLWFYNKVFPPDLHISEYEWVKCLLSNDYVTIPNYGTIDELNGVVDKMV